MAPLHTRFSNPLGQRLTERLARCQATQRQLAERLGVSRPHLNQMVTGRRRPWYDLEEQCMRALDERDRK